MNRVSVAAPVTPTKPQAWDSASLESCLEALLRGCTNATHYRLFQELIDLALTIRGITQPSSDGVLSL